jgi:hypothetical protein
MVNSKRQGFNVGYIVCSLWTGLGDSASSRIGFLISTKVYQKVTASDSRYIRDGNSSSDKNGIQFALVWIYNLIF